MGATHSLYSHFETWYVIDVALEDVLVHQFRV